MKQRCIVYIYLIVTSIIDNNIFFYLFMESICKWSKNKWTLNIWNLPNWTMSSSFKSLSLKMTKLEVGLLLLLLNKKKYVKLGVDVRHGIASIWNCTHLLKNVFNLFVCKNLTLFLQFSFLYLISNHEYNFKKMSAILCWYNTEWTGIDIDWLITFLTTLTFRPYRLSYGRFKW